MHLMAPAKHRQEFGRREPAQLLSEIQCQSVYAEGLYVGRTRSSGVLSAGGIISGLMAESGCDVNVTARGFIPLLMASALS